MKYKTSITSYLLSTITFLFLTATVSNLDACSTFKLQKGNRIVYGHNLNEGDLGIPGMVFINKRGTFKVGRTWTELTTKNADNPSGYSWISRYGSITFNCFGRDLPDGGMNEAGLYIWEMNEVADYPRNDSLPKLDQMNWMQYILDQYSTVEEAIRCASEIEISGWGWHFFVGDAMGNTAAIEFFNGDVVVHKNEQMPIPGLFNEPYEHEMRLLRYYKGYGGQYEIDVYDPETPRFVRIAKLIDDYDESESIVEYGLKMLQTLRVNDDPEWSILFDVNEKAVYFRTRLNPKIKSFTFDDIDFSNTTPVQIQDMDTPNEGSVAHLFHDFSTEIMESFLKKKLLSILPEEFFSMGGLKAKEVIHNLAAHTQEATSGNSNSLSGTWYTEPVDEDGNSMIFKLISDGEYISGKVQYLDRSNDMVHIFMKGNKLVFTYHTTRGAMIEGFGTLNDQVLTIDLWGIEEYHGEYICSKDKEVL